LKEHIVPSFFANGCLSSMPWQHCGFVGQGKDLLTDSANQQWMVASWEVGTAYTPSEQNVAVEQKLVVG
jgi:hypothetical protein